MVTVTPGQQFAESLRATRVGVIGFGLTGQATAKALLALGAEPLVVDTRPAEEVRELAVQIEALGLQPTPGPQAVAGLAGLPLVVVSPGVVLPADVESKLRQAGTRLIAEIELAYLLARGPIVAITGTNGKSTTTRMVAEMLKAAGIPAIIGGNIGEPLVEKVLSAGPGEILVAEVSSFQLEGCDKFRPAAAALLNVRADHLDRHGALEAYVAVKSRIFAQQHENDLAVGNYDDALVRAVVEQTKSQRAFFSRQTQPQPGAYLKGDQLLLALEAKPTPICTVNELPLPGGHNVENSLAACLLAARCGAPPEAMRRALLSFELAAHTLEEVGTYHGRRYVNDSKGTNPAATAAALEALGYPVVLIAGGSDKRLDFEELLEALQNWAKAVIAMGQTAPQLERVARRAGLEQVLRARDLTEAVRQAATVSQPGDTVVFSPASASFDMFRDYRDRGEQFRRAVREDAQ